MPHRLRRVPVVTAVVAVALLVGIGLAGPAGAGIAVQCAVRGHSFGAVEGPNTQQVVFRVTNVGDCAGKTATYTTRDGSALSGVDFVATSGTINLTGSQLITVDVLGDSVREWSEYLNLDIASETAVVLDTTLHGAIIDDEIASDVVVLNTPDVISAASADAIRDALVAMRHNVTTFGAITAPGHLALALADADALVVPHQDGEVPLGDALGEEGRAAVAAFTQGGGQLVAVGPNRGLFQALFGHALAEVVSNAGELTGEAANTEFSESVPRLHPGDALMTGSAITGASLPASAVPVYSAEVVNGEGVRASAEGDPDALVAVIPEGDGSATHLGWDWEPPLQEFGQRAIADPESENDNGWNGVLAASVQLPGLAIGDVTVDEGNSGTVAATFGITLDHKVSEVVSASAATADGTANAGSDFDAVAGVATIARGATTATVAVSVIGDPVAEPSETFALNLSSPEGAAIVRSSGVGTIVNDDAGVTGGNRGFVLFGGDGGLFAYGGAPFVGTLGTGGVSAKAVRTPSGMTLNSPIVDGITTPSGNGFWLAAADGGVFTKGDAGFFGSAVGLPLNAPIVGIVRTPSGNGYLLAAADGGVFAFGDAVFRGSLGALKLNAPIVGIASSGSGLGYWLVAGDGGVFTFGDAGFHGSLGSLKLNALIVDMVGTPTSGGYWLAAADGGVFAFGDAPYLGSMAHKKLNGPIVGIDGTGTGQGYRMTATDGGVFDFGDSIFYGSLANDRLNQPIIGMSTI